MSKYRHISKDEQIELLSNCLSDWRDFAYKQEKLLKRCVLFIENASIFVSLFGFTLDLSLRDEIERVVYDDFIPKKNRKVVKK